MATVKLELKLKSDTEVIADGDTHITKMTGNVAFPTPDPDAAAFLAGKLAFAALVASANAAKATAKEKTQLKDDGRVVYEGLLSRRGDYVQTESGGDEALILSAGFDVRAPQTALGVPEPLAGFTATMGDLPGEMDLSWDREKAARTYETQYREDVAGSLWVQGPPSTKSRVSVAGLTTGKVYHFRTRGIGSAGVGGWSTEAAKMAP